MASEGCLGSTPATTALRRTVDCNLNREEVGEVAFAPMYVGLYTLMIVCMYVCMYIYVCM